MRLTACNLHPSLKPHEPLIKKLGPDSMSSDESDYGELGANPPARLRAPRYYVVEPQWRHPNLGDFLDVFSTIYFIRRWVGNSLRGSYPCIHQHSATSARISTSKKFVSHLSISVYKPDWLASQIDVAFVVCPTQEVYSLEHAPDIFE